MQIRSSVVTATHYSFICAIDHSSSSSLAHPKSVFVYVVVIVVKLRTLRCLFFSVAHWFSLSVQEGGRRALWSVNGTRILQVGYENEEDPKVMDAYEKLGSLVRAWFLILSQFMQIPIKCDAVRNLCDRKVRCEMAIRFLQL